MKDIDIPVCLRYNEMYDFNWTTKEIDESDAEFVICHHENDPKNIKQYHKHNLTELLLHRLHRQ